MQRGFTLVELTVATGIVALLAAGGALALAQHPMGSPNAFAQLRAQIEAAKALAAASGDGATVTFTPEGSGFRSEVFSGRPDGVPALSQIAPVDAQASVAEASTGAPPFSLFVSGAGDFSVAAGARQVPSSEPACPSSGLVRLEISDPSGARHTLDLPCRQSALGAPDPVATNSPVP